MISCKLQISDGAFGVGAALIRAGPRVRLSPQSQQKSADGGKKKNQVDVIAAEFIIFYAFVWQISSGPDWAFSILFLPSVIYCQKEFTVSLGAAQVKFGYVKKKKKKGSRYAFERPCHQICADVNVLSCNFEIIHQTAASHSVTERGVRDHLHFRLSPSPPHSLAEGLHSGAVHRSRSPPAASTQLIQLSNGWQGSEISVSLCLQTSFLPRPKDRTGCY